MYEVFKLHQKTINGNVQHADFISILPAIHPFIF